MKQRCPWCREPLPFGERSREECPHCGRKLVGEEGREIRPIDVHYKQVVAGQSRRFRQILLSGSAAAVAVFVAMPLLNVAAVVVVPLALLAHIVAVRLFLIRDARCLLSTARRMFTRWIARLAFLWVGLPGYSLSVVPVIGLVPGILSFVALTTLVHHYVLWSLDRERQRLPLTTWEKLLLASLAVLTIFFLILVLGFAAFVGWSGAKLIEMVRGG